MPPLRTVQAWSRHGLEDAACARHIVEIDVHDFHGENPSMTALETLALLALTMTACGAPRAPAAARPPPTSAAATGKRGATTRDDWAPLSWEERHDLMTWSLLPAMMPDQRLRRRRLAALGRARVARATWATRPAQTCSISASAAMYGT